MQPAPLLVHYCQACEYNTPVPYTVSVFSQNCCCAHCGAISQGVNVRRQQEEEKHSEHELKSQSEMETANMQQQEELTRLFSANMNLSQTQQPPPQTPIRQTTQQQTPSASPPSIVYASSHYTHTSHIAPTLQRALFPPSPPMKTPISASDLATILLSNAINPSTLFPSQLDLFQNADDDQRLRLLELWRISPPSPAHSEQDAASYAAAKQLYDWPPTSVAQEEEMAKLRFQRSAPSSPLSMNMMVQEDCIRAHDAQLDESMIEDMGMSPRSESPAVRSTRDFLSMSNVGEGGTGQGEVVAEPYMVSGYDMLARSEYEASAYNAATDPVYASMENQYGAFAGLRDMGDEEMVM